MNHPYDHAVILGASMSGLLAARALSPYFADITIVERDVLPDEAVPRKGTPQSAHAHGLLANGYRVMASYFPGLMKELQDLGAPHGDVVGDFLWFQYGRWKLRHDAGLRGITVTRPCLETAVRRRVRDLPNVTFRENMDGLRPRFDPGTGRICGLLVRDRQTGAEETLTSDLLIDASGRGSQSPRWLEEFGCGRPEQVTVTVNVGYATRFFERKPGEFFDTIGGIISATPPHGTRYGAVLAAEGNRWMVTLVGTLGDYPPTDEAGWNDFASTLPVPAVHDLVTVANALTDIAGYRFPANQRRLYERMQRFPAGYLVLGDALCSFNPIYGQGMTVAAAEAEALEESLHTGLEGLSRRFYQRARKIVDIPWSIATGEDLRFPQVEGRRPPGTALVNRYFDRVHAIASRDPVVCRRFFDVLNLLATPYALMAPRIAWRVLTRRVPAGTGSPWGNTERHNRIQQPLAAKTASS